MKRIWTTALTISLLIATTTCTGSHEAAVPADADASLSQSQGDVGLLPETVNDDMTEDPSDVGTVPISCLGAVGVLGLAQGATLQNHDIVGVLEAEDGPFIAWEQRNWPNLSPPVSHQLRLSRFDCEGKLAWTAALPKDWADSNIAPPLIPLSRFGADGAFACAHDRCRAYDGAGNELWTTGDSHDLLGVFWAHGSRRI